MLALANGFVLCLGLIVSIGPQNTEILRFGLLNDRVVLLASVFISCDAILIAMGALGLGSIIALNPTVTVGLTVLTASFLFYLTFQAFFRAIREGGAVINIGQRKRSIRIDVIKRAIALSLLNPLALLETVVILGSSAALYPISHRVWFVAGALAASATWFYGLAFSSRRFSAFISLPSQRRIMEGALCAILFTTACWLLLGTGYR